MSSIFAAFIIGFSDYMIKLNITQDIFTDRFFGPEGNSLMNSFIALDGNMPIGLILGGKKLYEGIRTMHCGTLAIHPDYRGKGISQKLMLLHQEDATINKCQQLFLEVLSGNKRAINFYKKQGYEKIYDLNYFALPDLSTLEKYEIENICIKNINFESFQIIADIKEVHTNWQNHRDYLAKCQNLFYFAAFKINTPIATLCISLTGTIKFIWVAPNFRCRRIASALLFNAHKSLALKKLTLGFPNNNLLQGFLKKLNFEKDAISQYEMYKTI